MLDIRFVLSSLTVLFLPSFVSPFAITVCRKYTTFDKLDEAINDVTDESIKKPTTSDYEVVKQNKERKFRSLLVGSNGTMQHVLHESCSFGLSVLVVGIVS
jgi:hypothetical protein